MAKIKQIQKKVDEIKEYFISFERDFSEKQKNVYKINLGFPISWNCSSSENIEYQEIQTIPPQLKIVYIKNLNPDITIDDLFEFVKHIVKINKEHEQQKELLQSKIKNIANDFFVDPNKKTNKIKPDNDKKVKKVENSSENKKDSFEIVEGKENSNLKKVKSHRPNVEPAPQKKL